MTLSNTRIHTIRYDHAILEHTQGHKGESPHENSTEEWRITELSDCRVPFKGTTGLYSRVDFSGSGFRVY